MSKKNILIISYSYPPSNAPAAQRPYSLAKYLDKSKFNVIVLTCSNQDSSLGLNENLNIELGGVTLIKVRSFNTSMFKKIKGEVSKNNKKNSKKNSFKRVVFRMISKFIFPDKGALWLPFVIPYVLFNITKFKVDVIFSTSPLFTNHLIARFVKVFNRRAKHISDIRDYHFIENDNFKIGFTKNLHKIIEKWIIKKSNNVCFITETMKLIYSNHFPKFKDKFVAIYNGYDEEEFPEIKRISEIKKLTFFYAGSFYNGVRSPKPLLLMLEYLLNQKLIKEEEFQIEIAGVFDDNISQELEGLKAYKRISFLGLLPRNEILKRYVNSHILWLIIGDKINHYTGVPIKMYEYIGSRRPIINFTPKNSETESIIDKIGLGWNLVNGEEKIQENSEVILEIFKLYRDNKLNEPMVLKDTKKYLRKNQAKEFEKLIYG